MSTVSKPLEYLWTAYFEDETVIEQPEDDRYSKHDPNSEWNPSAYRDVLDKIESGVAVDLFVLVGDGTVHTLDLVHGKFTIDGTEIELENDCRNPRKLIYYRTVEKDYIDGIETDARITAYSFGYEYKDDKGRVQKKVITLNG